MIASTLFSNSHTLMTIAVVVLVITIVWRLITKCQARKRNLITRALLVAVVTTVGVGVYPILFKKKTNTSDAKKGDIEKTGGTIFICKITPMRDENGEKVAATLELKQVHRESRRLADRIATDPENKIVPGYKLCGSYEGELSGELNVRSTEKIFALAKGMQDAAETKSIASALLNPLVHPLVILEERTVSAELALQSAESS